MKAWETEPEKADFEAHGLKCAMRRNPAGAWCGYVGVNNTHPWFGKDETDTVKVAQEIVERPIDIDKVGIMNLLCGIRKSDDMEDGHLKIALAIDVHGGLTYASTGAHIEKGSKLWWFGFDCSHSNDFMPASDSPFNYNGTYRDFEYVKSECESLAKQLAGYQTMRGIPQIIQPVRINDDT